MCRYQAASEAVAIAARRASYTARNASKLASGIKDERSQVLAEATELVDEWVVVQDGLATAEEVLTFVAQNREAFEAFRTSCHRQPLATARRPGAAPAQTRAPGPTASEFIRMARGR